MPYATIVKSEQMPPVAPNLPDYAAECTPDFWARARLELDGLPGGRGLNIAYEAVDRHAAGPRADHLALRWFGRHGDVRDSPTPTCASSRTASRTCFGRSASARATSSASSPGGFPSCTLPRSGR